MQSARINVAEWSQTNPKQMKTNKQKLTSGSILLLLCHELFNRRSWSTLVQWRQQHWAVSRQAVCCKKQRFAVIFSSPSTSLSPFCSGGLHNTVGRPCASCQACPAQDQHGQKAAPPAAGPTSFRAHCFRSKHLLPSTGNQRAASAGQHRHTTPNQSFLGPSVKKWLIYWRIHTEC